MEVDILVYMHAGSEMTVECLIIQLHNYADYIIEQDYKSFFCVQNTAVLHRKETKLIIILDCSLVDYICCASNNGLPL